MSISPNSMTLIQTIQSPIQSAFTALIHNTLVRVYSNWNSMITKVMNAHANRPEHQKQIKKQRRSKGIPRSEWCGTKIKFDQCESKPKRKYTKAVDKPLEIPNLNALFAEPTAPKRKYVKKTQREKCVASLSKIIRQVIRDDK